MSTKVKICGITRVSDAMHAAESGADAIGLMFYSGSPRCIAAADARAISRELPPFILRVGVFVNPTEDEVREAIAIADLTMLQFHGEEAPEFCTQFGVMSMKAIRVRDEGSLAGLREHCTDAWLLDAYSPDAHGGTGATFNWDLAVQAVAMGRPVFLAGGLTAANVAEAVRRVRPFGVDVSSGVEASPGVKDPAKVSAFIAAVRSAEAA